MSVFIPLLKVILPLIVLWKICEIVVDGIRGLTQEFRIPWSIAGGVLAIITTSIPEIGTSFFSILVTEQGKYPEIAMAAILGSAIFNLLAIIGISALFHNLEVSPKLYFHGIAYFIAAILFLAAIIDGRITLWETGGGLFLYALYSVVLFRRDKKTPPEKPIEEKKIPCRLAFLYSLGGLIIIGLACHFLVQGVVEISQKTGISKILISIFAIAVGTSIPDCFASIAASRKGHGAMALYYALGSNIFHIFICLGFPLFILNLQGVVFQLPDAPIERTLLLFSFFYLTIALFAVLCILRHKWTVGKNKGLLLILLYIIYIVCIFVGYVGKNSSWMTEIQIFLEF